MLIDFVMILIHNKRFISFAYQNGETREELFKRLVAISTAYKIVGRCQAGYHFVVPGVAALPFGPEKKLRLIGDKMAGVTSRKQLSREELVKFQRYVGMNVSLIHVVRNPFDMVCLPQPLRCIFVQSFGPP